MGLVRQKVRLFSTSLRQVKKLYQVSFPPQERIPFTFLMLNTWRGLANCFAYFDKGKFVGFAYVISNHELFYIFFLAVEPLQQSRGYGSLILKDLKTMAGQRSVIVSIEPIDSKSKNNVQRLKRLAFYESNGFQLSQDFYQEGSEIYQIILTKDNGDNLAFQKLMQSFFLGFIKVRILNSKLN